MTSTRTTKPSSSVETTAERPLNAAQEIQGQEYEYPYHYVAQFAPCFAHLTVDTWGINYVSTIEYILGIAKRSGARSVLDIGCGDGRLTRELAHHLRGVSVVGVDYSECAIGLARALNPDMAFYCCDIRNEAIAGGPCESELVIEVLEHVPRPEIDHFLQGMARALRPGAELQVTVPHVNAPLEPKHEHHLTAASLAAALEKNFEIDRIVPVEASGWKRRLINRVLTNRYVALRHGPALDRIYRWYKDHLFNVDSEAKCLRLHAVVRVRQPAAGRHTDQRSGISAPSTL